MKVDMVWEIFKLARVYLDRRGREEKKTVDFPKRGTTFWNGTKNMEIGKHERLINKETQMEEFSTFKCQTWINI